MRFSGVYSFIDNDTRHRSGQNVVESWGAAEWVRNKFIYLYTTLNHIRFVFYHSIKETKSLSWQLKTLTRIWRCTRSIMQMSCLYASDSFKKSKDAYSLSKRVHTTKNHISIFFFFHHNINVKENGFFFQSAIWKKHCVTHWREQRGMDSYLPRQISQWDCEISSNCD